ncbi:MAG TPA: hypothetical protein VMW24_11720 [Sedimentisphaerales bacterium]|nr:hypothetical protein [Sedimentisphaerales bacterium]
MRGRATSWEFLTAWTIALLLPLTAVGAGGGQKSGGQTFVFELDEISAFDLDNQVVLSFIGGQRCYCTEKSADEVKTYPAFKSDKPLYGSVEFRSQYDGELPGPKYYFALDESGGTGSSYDRFYFDLNQDLDLTNDVVLSPQKGPPNSERFKNTRALQETFFEYLNIAFELGDEGVRPLRILPWFVVSTNTSPLVRFVNPVAHKGKIELGSRRYNVFLGHDYIIGGWFHRPLTAVYLAPEGESYRTSWRGADRLMAVHKIEGTFYKLSATPEGNKLTAQEYDGPFGTFEIGAGGRDIQPGMIAAGGSFRSRDMAVAVGGPKCILPVGDYLPSHLTIAFVDHVTISLSDNYHADGKPGGAANRKKNYAITIRQNKPYIFDLSNRPDVLFATPEKDQRVKLGEELTVKAVLIDPELDFMIRGLNKIVRTGSPDVSERRIGKSASLDPKVVITRANGEQVADGVMPFG